MQITYLGHACFQLEIAGKTLLFDPFITYNELAKNVDVSSLRPDYILVTHGHQDHTADLVQVAKQSQAQVIAAYEITTWLEGQGHSHVHPMNIGGKVEFPFGSVKMVAAVHSSVLPDGTYAGNPAGFVINTAEGNLYFAGDTALTLDMQLIPRWSKLDFAILPIGDNFTMGIEDALVAADFVQCNTVIGMHYDTFGYIKIQHAACMEMAQAAGKRLILPEIGNTFTL